MVQFTRMLQRLSLLIKTQFFPALGESCGLVTRHRIRKIAINNWDYAVLFPFLSRDNAYNVTVLRECRYPNATDYFNKKDAVLKRLIGILSVLRSAQEALSRYKNGQRTV